MPPAILHIHCTRPAESPIPWALLTSVATLHDRQIRRLRALEDAPGVHADVAIRINQARSVAHQPADVGIGTRRIGRGETMMRRQVN
jgi:hypothetical protein